MTSTLDELDELLAVPATPRRRKATTHAASADQSAQQTQTQITGTVTVLFRESETWCAGRIRLEGDSMRKEYGFTTSFRVRSRERYTMVGTWVVDKKYGHQFKASSLAYTQDTTPAGLVHFLTTDKRFRGIGPVYAKRIVDACTQSGMEFDQLLKSGSGYTLLRSCGLTNDQITTLRSAWAESAERNGLFTWLSQFELTQCQMQRLTEAYGAATRSILENNPYILCREVRGYGFARTDIIALRMGVAKDNVHRIRACVTDILYSITDDGHCYLPATDLLRKAEDTLGISSLREREAIKQVIHDMISQGELCFENIPTATAGGSSSLIASPGIYRAEAFLRDAFASAKQLPPPALAEDRVTLIMDDWLPDLNECQERAVRMVLRSRICAIGGEAGTGKTFAIGAICSAYQILGKSVYLASPTGKAAKRMTESVGNTIEAKTIHRLLGFQPFGGEEKWTYNKDNPLECDLLIVDEVGMLDVLLAQRLFEAVDLSRTQVVLVGDPAQLPPVGAGNLLRDVLASHAQAEEDAYCPVVMLEQVVRQAGVLKENCVAVLRGTLADTTEGDSGTLRPWYRMNHCQTPEDVLACLLHVIEHELPKVGMQSLENWIVLSPQHKTPIGVRALNLHLQRLWQRLAYGRELPPVPEDAARVRSTFYPGDRVLWTKNNYRLGIMNGTTGMVLAVGALHVPSASGSGEDDHAEGTEGMKACIAIDFGETEPVYIPEDSEDISDLQLAYAMTVHKSQGSEIPCAIVICSRAHSYSLSRNLLYTAVTRARRSCIIIGDHVAMRRALLNEAHALRRTWLAAWRQQ